MGMSVKPEQTQDLLDRIDALLAVTPVRIEGVTMSPELRRRLIAAARRGLESGRDDVGRANPVEALDTEEHRPRRPNMTTPFTAPENPRPVRAKLYVESVKWMAWGTELILRVVTRGEDNKEWASATPSGSVTLMVANDKAAENFAPGQEWYVDFTPVPADQVGKEGMA